MNDVLYPLAAAAAWTALFYRLVRGVRRDARDPALYVVCGAFGLMGLVFTVSTPRVWGTIDHIVDVPNFSLLLSQSGVIAFSGTIQCLIIFWTHDRRHGWRRARWRLFAVLAVLAVMAVLFFGVHPRPERTHAAAAGYAGDPAYALYLAFYLLMVAVGVIDIIRLCLPYARDAGRSWLSRGLRAAAIGAGLGLVYCVIRAATLVGAQLGVDPQSWEFLVPLTSSVGAFLIVVGLTLPALGPRLSAARTWTQRQRSYRELYPLWDAVRRTMPEVVMDARLGRGGRAPRFVLRRLDERLHRRVIEIGDGLRQLRPYLAPGFDVVTASPADGGDSADGHRAVPAVAAQIRAALYRFEQDRRARIDAQGTATVTELTRRQRWDTWAATWPAAREASRSQHRHHNAVARRPGGRARQQDFAAHVALLTSMSQALTTYPTPPGAGATKDNDMTGRM